METLAGKHLKRQGLDIIERNFHSRRGEIDLICRDGQTLIFIEVRYRGQGSLATAAESISPGKQRRIAHAARYYLQKKALWHLPCRFDALLVEGDENRGYTFNWIPNAFSAAEP